MKPWDFDGDEVVFFIAAAILGAIGLYQWYWPLIAQTRLGDRVPAAAGRRTLLGLTPLAAMTGLLVVLSVWSDPKYVVGHIDYILLFAAGGLAWLAIAKWFGDLMGIDSRDDAIERDNSAAAVSVCATAIALMIIYAASNMGAGPTIWTTIWPAILATVVWFLLSFVVELTTGIGEQIAVERDLAAGVRHAGWGIAAALVLGRAMAGDWTAWGKTHDEFIQMGWPALLLTAAVIPLHRTYPPTPSQPRRSVFAEGIVPALVLIALAAGYVLTLGKPEIGRHIITYEEYMRSK